jgi:Protein of unknown function (DUF551)
MGLSSHEPQPPSLLVRALAVLAQALVVGVARALLEGHHVVSEWISMDERAPKHGQEVIYYTRDYDDGGIIRAARVTAGEFHREVIPDRTPSAEWYEADSAHFDDGGEGLDRVEAVYVTHWMPLPEPPKP